MSAEFSEKYDGSPDGEPIFFLEYIGNHILSLYYV